MPNIFDLKDVSYSYLGKFEALKDINLAISQGEQVSLIGTNGSGKSTLLSIIDALLFPTSGEFFAFGNLVEEAVFDSLAESEFRTFFRKKVAFVFQNSDVQLFSSTVFDEIAFGPLQLGMTQDEVKERVEDVMDIIEISKLAYRAPHTLSGGEKKKVCIASALATNPDVLLLDEPTAGLDPRTQLWLIELFQELGSAGKTIVVATHDLDTVEHISKRAVVMGEDHTIKADRSSCDVIGDLDLLLSANLIHKHMHRHGSVYQEHYHPQYQGHKKAERSDA
ncbi:energy-coupling factor ABC transporter ATP-binding protein [Methanocrinis sp.]|uniref:energy-coupling factor ABC transporter ATP-binding protein n=1 Tax=Methanocrinis sp. TaxID=3101522 RepID=UPI003D0D9E1D